MKVLLVEDDRRLAESLRRSLTESRMTVDVSHNGEDALAAASAYPYDVIVLDVMLPRLNGLEVTRRLREGRVETPILMLTARDAVDDRVAGLDAGADDYLVKPFALREVVARLRALSRRQLPSRKAELRSGKMVLDTAGHLLLVDQRQVELTTKEFAILEYFLLNPGRLLTRSQILEHAWDYDFDGGRNLIEVYIGRLRKKLIEAGVGDPFCHRQGFWISIRNLGSVMSIFRSTRGRLVVTAVAIFAIALVVADSVVLAAVNAFQWQETDAVLVAQAQLLVASAQDSNGQLSFDPSDLPGETPNGIAVDAALVAGGAVVSQTRNQPLTSDSLFTLARQATSAGHPVSVDLVDSRHVPRRAYAMQVGGGAGEVLIVSRSVVELLEFQGRTMSSLLAVSIVLLIMGGALTYWLAGRALRPVRTIAGIARSISEHDLHRRVDVKVPPDELGELVDTFNSMLARLEAGFESMGRFTADASHELRAPLTLMRAEIESAMRRGRSKEEYRLALESVQGEVDHLTRLTDQLLMLARADAGALKPAREPVDVADFLHETGARWEPVAARRSVRVEVSAPASGYVDGDPALLRRVIDNLVDNAIRYTGEGTAVALRGYASNGGWNVDVVDHGPGIPPRYRSELFSRFARPDMARSAEDGGAGLGLALSAAIARAHGGWLELVENGQPGAVFRLHLPRRVAA